MKLLLIRHAKAEERSMIPFLSKKDADRRLTDEGRKEMRKVAKGLREIAPDIDVLATSPLARARETAEIIAGTFKIQETIEQPLLAPDGSKRALIGWLKTKPTEATVALIGHEPQLSALAGLLISGKERSLIALKKGACCLIEFEHAPAIGGGMLLWLLQPYQLKSID